MARRSLILLLILVCISAAAATAAPAGISAPVPPTFGAVSSMTLVRPPVWPSGAVAFTRLTAARNETESTQLLVKAGGQVLPAVDLRLAGVLQTPSGAQLDMTHVAALARVATYTTTGLPSDGELGGGLGQFSDIVIPVRDTIVGEARTAFGQDLNAGDLMVGWLDVNVPAAAAAGLYTGARVEVMSAGRVIGSVPLELEVLPVLLPASNTLTGAYDINPNHLCAPQGPHACPQGAQVMLERYARLGLYNRVPLAKAVLSPPAAGQWPGRTLELLQGLTDGPRPGASIDRLVLYSWASEQADEYKRALAPLNKTNLLVYHCDEMGRSLNAWQACASGYARANSLWTQTAPAVGDLRLQMTTTIGDLNWAATQGLTALTSRVTTLLPVVNHLHPKTDARALGSRGEYNSWLAASSTHQLGMYSSCMSMGCSPAAADLDAHWNGWAGGYGVDQPPAQARAMGWTAFRYGITGDYYYETARDLTTAWTDLWSDDGGNHGDGTLFYPGTVARIGGVNDIPLESVRLKRIRDGREDYELLRILAARGYSTAVQAVAASLLPTLHDATFTAEQMQVARGKLNELAGGLPFDPEPAVTQPVIVAPVIATHVAPTPVTHMPATPEPTTPAPTQTPVTTMPVTPTKPTPVASSWYQGPIKAVKAPVVKK